MKYFTLLLLITFINGIIAVDRCPDLEVKFRMQKFLNKEDRRIYCFNYCEFMPNVICKPEVERTFPKIFGDLVDYVNKTRTVTYDRKSYGEVQFVWNSNWWDLVEYCLPFILTIIPVGISHSKLDYYLKVLFYVAWAILALVVDMDWMLCIYNIITVVFCLCVPERSSAAASVVVTMVMFIVSMIMAVCYNNIWVQIGFGLFSMVAMAAMLYKVIDKGNIVDFPAFFITLIQFFGLGRMIYLLMAYHGVDSLQLRMIQFFTEAVLPLGPATMLWENAFLDTAWVMYDLRITKLYPFIFLAFLLNFWILFLSVRCLIGVILIKRLRIKVDFRSFSTGFYVYMSDFFGGFHYIGRVLLGFESPTQARTAYAIVHLILFFREFAGAREFLLLRFVISVTDYCYYEGGYSRVPKYVDGTVNLNGISFPKEGSFPWFSLEKLHNLAKSVKRVVAIGVESSKQGVGLIVRNEEGDVGIYSAEHVLNEATSIKFDDTLCRFEELKKMGSSSDPVVFARISANVEGADISLLSRIETQDVKFLFSVHYTGMINMIEKFRFDNEGNIFAWFNIKQGDSGSPVIAVLSDGSMRYAGAISRGTFDEGVGNMISCVAALVKVGETGMKLKYEAEDYDDEDDVLQHAFDSIKDIMLKQSEEARDVPDDRGGEEHRSRQKMKRRKDRAKYLRKNFDFCKKFIKNEALRKELEKDFNENNELDFNKVRRVYPNIH
jgi:hypothetical protein